MPKLRYALSALVVLVVQTTFVSRWPLWNTTPSLVMVYLVALAILYGPKWGGYTGIALGLLEDIVFSNVLGVYALIYFVSATLVGRLLYHNQNQWATGTVVTAIVSIGAFLANVLIHWALGAAESALWMLGAPLFYFALINAICYPIVMWMLRRILKPEINRSFLQF